MEKLLRGEGVEDCRSLTTLGVKSNAASVILEDGVGDRGIQSAGPEPRKMDRQEMTRYRSVVARCSYLAPDSFEMS